MAMIPSAFSTKLVETLAETLAGYAKEEVVMLLGVPHEIESLHARLARLQDFLVDAEGRRLREHAINRWLNELKDVMYDADDIIDEYKIKRGKHLAAFQSQSSSPCLERCCHPPIACFGQVGFRHQIGNRIKSLNQRLEDIYKDMTPLNLVRTPTDPNARRPGISRNTSPLLVEADLAGERIEEDTRKLVDLLLNKDQRYQKISVFAILGMGGIGKTTLAQKIFNDEKLQDDFSHNNPRIWVCVSKDFSEISLLRAVITRAGGKPGEAKDRADLEPMLSEVVRNKKLLLVLDDVWDAAVWDNLLYKPLQSCSAGSRILLTSRDEAVARRMGAVYFHQVEMLSDEDGWSLICKMVFQPDGSEEYLQQGLRDTGMKIVKKCHGSPLALRTTAGVLRSKDKRQSEWEMVLRNSAWVPTAELAGDPVMGALYLSYQDLPPHLKQCFLYFAIYPEDYELDQDRCTLHWIAEGFVKAEDDLLMEELAEGYWRELVQRSLLQPNLLSAKLGLTVRCRMHDLVRSLAQHLARDECFCGNVSGLSRYTSSSVPRSMKLRSAYIAGRDQEEATIHDVTLHQESLRALIFPCLKSFREDATKKLRCSRMLVIPGSSITKLPESLGNLIHLRYLDVSNSEIRELPHSIGNLQNLQALHLGNCQNLHELPKSFVSLCNLRSLDVQGTPLEGIPAGLANLRHLNQLYGFVLSKSHGTDGNKQGSRRKQPRQSRYCTLEELNSLSHLRNLTLHRLEMASSSAEARLAALETKHQLNYLFLECTKSRTFDVHTPPSSAHYGKEATEKIQQVFQELCPPPSVTIIGIEGYFGLEYPSWLMVAPSAVLPNLTLLALDHCSCVQLPPLGLLPQLEILYVGKAPAVRSVGPELFIGGEVSTHSSRPSSFPKLKKLFFHTLPNWEEWWWLREEDKMPAVLLPCLDELGLSECPKLHSLPEGLLHHAAALTRVVIAGADSLTGIKNLPHVKELIVHNCGKLREVEGVASLQALQLEDSEMESLPVWLLPAAGGEQEVHFSASLNKLIIHGNTQLLRRCVRDGPDWHKIRHITRVEVYSIEDESAYIRYTKSPFNYQDCVPILVRSIHSTESSSIARIPYQGRDTMEGKE